MQNNLVEVKFIDCSIMSNLFRQIHTNIPNVDSKIKVSFTRRQLSYRTFLPRQLNVDEKDILCYLQKSNTTSPSLNFKVNNDSLGYLDFILNGHSFNLWLNNLPEKIKQLEIIPLNEEPNFILHYTHARCQSLLRLGIEEKIIKKEFYFTQRDWLQLNSIWEKKLFWQLLEITDNHIDHNSLLKLAQAIINFERNCRIWGDVKKNNLQITINRLALVAFASYILNFIAKNLFAQELLSEL